MKRFTLMGSVLAVSLAGSLVGNLAISTPTAVFAHVGHGDEFQAEGGINRVKVNAETDPMLGIQVNPIEPATNGSAAVLIPVAALVDAGGKQLAFVQYNDFYEPVPITTGATQGELIEVTQGLSVGENLVTQGSLSLYAESRKTQSASPDASPDASPAAASPQTATTHAQADAQGLPHSHDAAGNLAAQPGETQQTSAAQPSRGFPLGIMAATGGGIALLVGSLALLGGNRKKKGGY